MFARRWTYLFGTSWAWSFYVKFEAIKKLTESFIYSLRTNIVFVNFKEPLIWKVTPSNHFRKKSEKYSDFLTNFSLLKNLKDWASKVILRKVSYFSISAISLITYFNFYSDFIKWTIKKYVLSVTVKQSYFYIVKVSWNIVSHLL